MNYVVEDFIDAYISESYPIDNKELKIGEKEEAEEHDVPLRFGRKIATDHLKKFPKYYTKMKEIEKSGILGNKPGEEEDEDE